MATEQCRGFCQSEYVRREFHPAASLPFGRSMRYRPPNDDPVSSADLARICQAGLTGYATAKKHGVSQMTVSNMRRGKTYRKVTLRGFTPSTMRRPGRQPKRGSR